MLDHGHGLDAFDEAWERLPVRAPNPIEGDIDASRDSLEPYEKRKFVRLRCQGRAILNRRDEHLAVYVVDVSRSGIGLISPVQLFPSEFVGLTTPDRQLSLRVVRCIRLGPGCFHCGCKFQRREEAANQSPQPELQKQA
jgi:hypothetical protein